MNDDLDALSQDFQGYEYPLEEELNDILHETALEMMDAALEIYESITDMYLLDLDGDV